MVEYPMWENEIEEAINSLNSVTLELKELRKQIDIVHLHFDNYLEDIKRTLNYWVGYTHIGEKKTESVKNAYQKFFVTLYDLLIAGKNCKNTKFKRLSKAALYQGRVYRYLGHGESCNDEEELNEVVLPEYNDIYVSWSKNRNSSSVKYKLYGTKVLLICDIKEPYYGIDFEAFGIRKNDEQEVVFPTIQDTIIECILIKDNHDV